MILRRGLSMAMMLVCCLFAGCKSSPGNAPAAGAMGPAEATQLLARAVETRRSGDSILASGDMKIHDRASNFSLGMQIENFAAVYPDRMRLKTTKLAGTVDVFDALMRGDNIAFFVPRHNTLYTGKVSELRGGGLSFSPDRIVSRLLKGDRALLDKKWTPLAPAGGKNARGKNGAVEVEEVHQPGAEFLRVRLDPRRGTIARIAYCDAHGAEYLVEEYDNYRDVDGGRNPGAGQLFPTRFNLLWPGQDRFVKINLKKADLSRRPEELAEAFEGIDGLDLERVQRKALGQAHIDSDPSTMQDE